MDSSNRTPIEYKTPSGIVFALKPYLTGEEVLEIELASTQSMNAETAGLEDGERPNVKVNFSEMRRMEIHKKIEMTVASVGEKTDNVLRLALDLPSPDFKFILEKVEALVNPPVTK